MVARRRIARSQSSKIKTKSAKKDKNLLEEEKQEERAEESDNSIDWADISMEEELLGDLLDYVKDAYDEVRKDEDKIINTEGLERYLWAHQQTPKRYQALGEIVEPDLKSSSHQCTDPSIFTIRSIANAVLQKCPSHSLERLMSTPKMQYWTMTEINVMCKDEKKLSHMPFIGDGEVDDSSFGEELLETFAEGIHGTRTGCGEVINDNILYKLIKLLFVKHPDINKRMIFEAIHKQFPNKASVRELPSLYDDLKRRYEPEDSSVEDKLMAGYIDGTAYSSFRLLRCCRCFNYDCMLHGFGSAEDQEMINNHRNSNRNMSKNRKRGYSLNASNLICGANCFRLNMDEQSRKQLSTSNNKELNIKTEMGTVDDTSTACNDQWTISQQSMFVVLKRIYKNDFCKITNSLNCIDPDAPRKTCAQVYAYSLRNAPLSPRGELSPNSPKKKKYMKDQHRTFRATKWASTEGKVTNRHNYEPCSHKGPCSDQNCNCVIVGNVCAKFCQCSDHCIYRFPGCRCAPGMCRTKQCQCFFANWECDPDVCKSCGCDDLHSPLSALCKNMPMQRGLQKKLFIAPSQVAGWGCFTAEDIPKNEFISEYCGEIISHDESERRGKIYDKKKCSYLFGLNEEYLVDATRKGNVIRFANHSKDPNCKGRVFMVNGDHRIGIFARRNIVAGEELFFDYSYNSTQQIKFVSKERPKPH